MVSFKPLLKCKEYIVIHKPSGFLTYADSKDQIRISAKDHLEYQLKQKVYPVHRIDKDTCGILVFALKAEMAPKFTELFRSRAVMKRSWASVSGEAPESGVIDQPLKRHKEKKMENALTKFQRMATGEMDWQGEQRKYSFLECAPETGRYHQIRRHLKFLGFPIVGDPEYGNSFDTKVFAEKFGVSRTLLSAVKLEFPDRGAEKMVRISSKPDPDFKQVMDFFHWK